MIKIITLACSILFMLSLNAQTDYVYDTFDDTRIVNGHSVETNEEGILTFIIAHRFGPMNSGPKNLWGLDFATMRMGLDYGLSNNFSIGIGRTSTDGTIDGYIKYKLLSQSSGEKNMPLSATIVAGYAIETKAFIPNVELDINQKSSYMTQVIIARKFSNRFSAQIMPTYIHRNLVADDEENDVVSLGFSGQYQILKNWSISAEYFATPKNSLPDGSGASGEYFQSLSLGFQIDTKGHIFQFHMSNSPGMVERIFISETNGSWVDGNIYFGFNITRDFKVKGRKIR